MRRRYLVTLAIVCVALGAIPAWIAASSVSGLTTFSDGQVASAAAINANFQAIATAVNDNDARIKVPTIQRKVGYGAQQGAGSLNTDPANTSHRALDAVKTRADTSLRVTWSDNFRSVNGVGRARWELLFNGQGCTNPGPINFQMTSHDGSGNNADNHHRHDTLVGYCKATSLGTLGAGTHRVTVRTHGGVLTGDTVGEPYLGWSPPDGSGNGSQFVLEVEEVL